MGFWIFMLIMNAIIPITMIGFGKMFLKNAPKEINMAFGYRTNMSTKNEDTVGNLGGIICAIQLILLIGSIFPTERALKNTFDKNGLRR